MNWNISREESEIMKGVAIWAIPLHNLLHWVGPLVRENEFYYNYSRRAYWMWNHLTHFHPNLLGDILSFFGWYGVPVFMFLTGYGIYKKYEQLPEEQCRWSPFLYYNSLKLIRLLAPAFLVYCVLKVFVWAEPLNWGAVLAQLTLTINVLSCPADIDPGVYWYFGLTLQFYVLYRLLFHRKNDRVFWGIWWLLLLADTAWLITMMPDPNLKVQPQMEYIRHNCVGWFIPFLMGVGWARKCGSVSSEQSPFLGTGTTMCIGCLLSVFLLVAFSFQQQLWLLTPMFAVTGTFCFVRLLRAVGMAGLFRRLGVLSAYIFVVHPLVRPFFKDWIFQSGQVQMDVHSWLVSLLYLLLSVALAYGYKVIVTKLPY